MKLIITVFSLALSSVCFAQIGEPQKHMPSKVVGKIAPMGSFVAELNYRDNPLDEKDTTYTLMFNDMTYKHITSIKSVSFSGIGNAVDGLYKVFKSVFLEENRKNKDYVVTVTLGKSVISISNYKNMGIVTAMFIVDNAYFALTEKQVDKLFGR